MCPPSCFSFQDLWRPQTRDQEEYIHLESVLHSESQNANQLASNQWHIWTPHTWPISEEGWLSVMSLDAHWVEQRCRENHLLVNCLTEVMGLKRKSGIDCFSESSLNFD